MTRSTAIITASFAPDLERCRLLCETIDTHVTGFSKHYILVEHADVSLFKHLESANRVVVDENDLFPNWIRAFPDPFYLGRRRVWLSLRTLPLRGWHAQQLRRIAIAGNVNEDALFYCDSDVAFLKPFDCAALWQLWADNAAILLGINDAPVLPHGYVGTLIAWRRDRVLGMCRRIEEVSAMHWMQAIGRSRRFSECTIYGHFADDMQKLAGHFIDTRDLCKVYWFAPAPTEAEFRKFIADMEPHQTAIGMQSFIGTDIDYVRRLIGE
jgi:hypothetical protein